MKKNGVNRTPLMNRAVREARAEVEARKALEEVLALSDEALDKELEAAGVDLADVSKKSSELHARFQKQLEEEAKAKGAAKVDIDGESQRGWGAEIPTADAGAKKSVKPGNRYIFAYAAAAAIATAGGVAYLATRPKPEPPPMPVVDAGTAPVITVDAGAAAPTAPTPPRRDDKGDKSSSKGK
jgi:hypothetical protein